MTKNELSNIYHLAYKKAELSREMEMKRNDILRELQPIQVRCKATFHIDSGIYSNNYFEVKAEYFNPLLKTENGCILSKWWVFDSETTLADTDKMLVEIRETIEAAEALHSELENKLDN